MNHTDTLLSVPDLYTDTFRDGDRRLELFITLQNTRRVPVQVRPYYQGQRSNLNFDTADRSVNIYLPYHQPKFLSK